MYIVGGTGNNLPAGVSGDNRLLVDSVAASVEHHVNHHDQRAYNVLFSQSPTANDDCILYIENSDPLELIIEGITISVDAACEVYFKIKDKGARNSPTPLTPTNSNAGSGNTADGVFEKGADLDGGAATLAEGVEVVRYVFRAAIDSRHINFEQDIILPKNATFTMWCSVAAATITAMLPFNYHSLFLG